MPRIVSIFLPHWPIERLTPTTPTTAASPSMPAQVANRSRLSQHHRPPAVVLSAERSGRQLVAVASPRACQAGIQPGMTLAHARALLPPGALLVQPHQPQRDERALQRLARALMRFSPSVQADPPTGVLLDIAGCAHLFGGESAMLISMRRVLLRRGFNAFLAVAPTIGAAHALARFAEKPAVSVDAAKVRQALAPLPLAALRLEEKVVTGLAELGLTHIEDLLALPRSTIPARFGESVLLRLDQALGQAVELLEPLTPHSPLEHTITFAGPTMQIEAVQAATRELLAMLHGSMQQREAGARALALTIERASLEPIVIPLALSSPSRDPKHLWSLLSPRLESIHLGHGVDALRLTVTDSARLPHRQLQCAAITHGSLDPLDNDGVGRLVDTFISMLGRTCVTRIAVRATHVPEDRFRLMPIAESPAVDLSSFAEEMVQRPSYLLDQPIPIRIEVNDEGRPMHVVLPRTREAMEIASCVGPECIACRWWDAPPPRMSNEEDNPDGNASLLSAPVRLYYRAQHRLGPVLWIYQDELSGHWYLHGWWS